MSTLILTTGTRDLQIKASYVEHREGNMTWRGFPIKKDPSGQEEGASGLVFGTLRESTRQMVKRPDEYETAIQEEIEYPIVRSAIEYVLNTEAKIDHLIFVVTNQPDHTPDRFRGADTKFVPPILQKLIERDFPAQVATFRTFEVGCAPVETDEVAAWLDTRWRNFVGNVPGSVFLMTQTGVANLKLMLFMKCLEMYPQLRYLTKPKGERLTREDKLPYRFRTNYYNHQIRASLESYRYSDIMFLEVGQEVVLSSKYAFNLLAFNFEEAQQAINDLRREYRQNRSFYDLLYEYLRDVKNDLNLKVLTMFQAAQFSYLQHDYAGFLIRLFALSESMAKPAVEQIVGASTQYDPTGAYTAWQEALNQPKFESLIQACENSSQGKGGLNPYEPTFRVMLEILNWESERSGKKDPFLEVGKSILSLRDMRNIIAHSLDGVDPDQIEQKLPKKDLKKDAAAYPATEAFLGKMKGYFFKKQIRPEYVKLFDKLNEHIITCLT
jgi:hypothetical protein